MASGRLRDCTVSFWPIVVSLGWSFIRCSSRFALPLAPRRDTIGVADEGRSAHHHPQAHLEVLGGLVRSRSVSVFHLQLHYSQAARHVKHYLSGVFGSGILFLHLASAAALFNFLRSGCWA